MRYALGRSVLAQSKSQIDRLGERLKSALLTAADLGELDEYRLSALAPYAETMVKIRAELAVKPTGRPLKTTPSIVDKLRRERTRLSQIQDIAGCRIVVANLTVQDGIVRRVRELFGESVRKIIDRRKKPSHGYRAVHIVIRFEEWPQIEVQVRTGFQHLWGELSEILAVRFGQSVKYGGGPEEVQATLMKMSESIQAFEAQQARLVQELPSVAALVESGSITNESTKQKIDAYADAATAVARLSNDLRIELESMIELHRARRGQH